MTRNVRKGEGFLPGDVLVVTDKYKGHDFPTGTLVTVKSRDEYATRVEPLKDRQYGGQFPDSWDALTRPSIVVGDRVRVMSTGQLGEVTAAFPDSGRTVQLDFDTSGTYLARNLARIAYPLPPGTKVKIVKDPGNLCARTGTVARWPRCVEGERAIDLEGGKRIYIRVESLEEIKAGPAIAADFKVGTQVKVLGRNPFAVYTVMGHSYGCVALDKQGTDLQHPKDLTRFEPYWDGGFPVGTVVNVHPDVRGVVTSHRPLSGGVMVLQNSTTVSREIRPVFLSKVGPFAVGDRVKFLGKSGCMPNMIGTKGTVKSVHDYSWGVQLDGWDCTSYFTSVDLEKVAPVPFFTGIKSALPYDGVALFKALDTILAGTPVTLDVSKMLDKKYETWIPTERKVPSKPSPQLNVGEGQALTGKIIRDCFNEIEKELGEGYSQQRTWERLSAGRKQVWEKLSNLLNDHHDRSVLAPAEEMTLADYVHDLTDLHESQDTTPTERKHLRDAINSLLRAAGEDE